MGGRSKPRWVVIRYVKSQMGKITNSLRDLFHLPDVNQFLFLFDLELGKHLPREISVKRKRDGKQKRKLVFFLDHYVCSNISYHLFYICTLAGLESSIDWFILWLIGLFFHFCFRLQQTSFHWIVSDGFTSGMGILLPTPTVWFSLDRIAQPFWLRVPLWKPLVTSENQP